MVANGYSGRSGKSMYKIGNAWYPFKKLYFKAKCMFVACIIKKYSIDFVEHFRYCFEKYQKSLKSSLKNIPSANSNPIYVKLFHKARYTDEYFPLN